MKGQAVADFVVLIQVFPNRVDHQSKQIGVLVHQQRHRQVALQCTNFRASAKYPAQWMVGIRILGCVREERTYDLLLAVLWARNQVYGFHVSNVHLVTQDVREDNLGYISVPWTLSGVTR